MASKDVAALDAANNGSAILHSEGLPSRACERAAYRSAAEPVTGRLTAAHRPWRNFREGLFGVSANVMLAAAAFNFKRAARLLLRLDERVVAWRRGKQEQNSRRQSTPWVPKKNAMQCF